MSHIQPKTFTDAKAEVHSTAYKLIDLCERHALNPEEVFQAAMSDRLNTLASLFAHRR